jgi:ethanolamine permease
LFIPILFGHSLATVYVLGQLIPSMAESNLLPKLFAKKLWKLEWPCYASMAAVTFSFIAVLVCIMFNFQKKRRWTNSATMIVAMCGMITYCIQLVGFVVLRVKLSKFPRKFTSPFGIPGAIFSFMMFLLGVASVLCIHVERKVILGVTAFYILVPTVYYFTYAKYVQTFSEAEKAVTLPAHAEIKDVNGKSHCIVLSSFPNVHLRFPQIQNICTAGSPI